MNKGNFTAIANFPVSTYTYDFLQQMSQLAGKLAALGGLNYILSGCIKTGNTVGNGFVVIGGEPFPFKGGELKDKITIRTTYLKDHFKGVDYPEAYVLRTVEFSDTGEYNWGDFAQVITNEQLQKKIENLKGDPVGIIKEYGGLISTIPDDYMLCDGRILSAKQYPELYERLRYTYGGDGSDQFRIPNFSGRVGVGYDSARSEYDLGKFGGVEKVTLSTEQIPEHRHAYTDDTNAQGKYPQIEEGFPSSISGVANVKSSAESTGWGTVYNSGKVGGNQEHENRQPYIVIPKIIKVK